MNEGLTWIKGMESPNKKGRPKGSKRNWKRELQRFISRNGSAKELERLYDHLESTSEQTEMLKWVYSYIVPKPVAESISEDELQTLHDKLSDLVEENSNLKKQLSDVRKAI